MVLASNALRVLDHVGVYPGIRGLSHIDEGVDFVNVKGEALGWLSLGGERKYGYPAARTLRENVRRELLGEWEKREGRVEWGRKCVDVKELEDRVTVRFEDGEEVKVGVCVGADGLFSRVRRAVDPGASVEYSGQVVIMAFAERKTLSERAREYAKRSSMIFGKEGSFAVFPASGDGEAILLFFTLEKKEDMTREEWRAMEADKDGLRRRMRERFSTGGWPEVVGDLIEKAPDEKYLIWPFREINKLSRWSSDGGHVVLMGDSGHAIPPSVGQGGAMALEDAESLALTISEFYSDKNQDSSLKQLVERWEQHRRDKIQKVIERTKAGSHMRRATTDAESQRKKEEELKGNKGFDGELDLHWLYGYDTNDFALELRGEQMGFLELQ